LKTLDSGNNIFLVRNTLAYFGNVLCMPKRLIRLERKKLIAYCLNFNPF
jgi:hypothetical protein